MREHRRLSEEERDRAVDDLIELVGAVDGILQAQSGADAEYFFRICGRALSENERQRVKDGLLKAYRWQYIVTGVQEPRFASLLGRLVSAPQAERIGTALAPILQ